jgi:23S rRNA pseudouridine1911/1915/1917 synthase
MARPVALVVDRDGGRMRLDLFLARRLTGESRAEIQRLILAGRVTLNGRVLKRSARVHPGDRILVSLAAPAPSRLTPERIPVTVLYEDSDLLVALKPAGMVVHPGAGVSRGTLVHALLGREGSLSAVGGGERPGIVHRLDRETSGVLVVARNDRTHRALSGQFASRSVGKIYYTLVWGRPDPPWGRIDAPVGRHPVARTRMAVRRSGGRAAVTEYRVLETLGPFAFLEVRTLTGRTHQIRVHLRHRGHAIVGDARYGGAGFSSVRSPALRSLLQAFGRLALHAAVLEFSHPATGERLRFQAELPADFSALLSGLREAKCED